MKFLCFTVLLLMSSQLEALTLFEKVGLLRFGNEIEYKGADGLVDLTKLRQDAYYHVKGDLLYIPDRFVEPEFLSYESFQAMVQDPANRTVNANIKSWPAAIPDLQVTRATMMMRFKVDQPQVLALVLPRYYHGIKLYFIDRESHQLLFEFGDYSKNSYLVNYPLLSFEAKSDFYIMAHVGAPLRNGEAITNLSSFYIGNIKYLEESQAITRYFARAISGGFFIMTLFYGFIFAFRPRDRSSLYLSFYALACYGMSCIYTWNLTLEPAEMLNLFTFMNIASITALQHFLLNKLSFKFSVKTYKILKVISKGFFVGVVIGVLTEADLFLALLFSSSFIVSYILVFSTVYLGIKHKLNGIVYFCIGTMFNSAFQFPIFLSYTSITPSENGYYVLMAGFSMAISLALVNAKEFAVTYKRSVKQGKDLEKKNKEIMFFNKNLEKMVNDKTKEVRALLDYIPQGVLSIVGFGEVSSDYSAHLASILELEDIGNKRFDKLILSRCELGEDEKDQAWQAILSAVGELSFNFEVNCDKLPSELIYRAASGTKALKVTWNYQLDENEEIERILVTFLDVTAEKKLEKAAEAQRRELIKIQELVNVPASKAGQFFSTSIPLLKEIESTIYDHKGDINQHDFRTLFVNAHTVKGASRTLHLSELTESIHLMEGHFSAILKEKEAVDVALLVECIRHTMSIFDEYQMINTEKLNRSQDYSKVAIDRDFIEKHYQVLKSMTNHSISNLDEFLEIIHNQSEELTNLIFEQLPAIFIDYEEKAAKIAKDLGKLPPMFHSDIDDISVSPEIKVVLDNCMIHILRNILDHGIEHPSARQAIGKTEFGHIRVTGKERQGILQLQIGDDGQGLDMKKLYQIGSESGKLPPNASHEKITEVIFESGVSTADEVTDMSGRGVGMNAVREFLEKAGGQISVVLEAPNDPKKQFFSFHFSIAIPLQKKQSLPEVG